MQAPIQLITCFRIAMHRRSKDQVTISLKPLTPCGMPKDARQLAHYIHALVKNQHMTWLNQKLNLNSNFNSVDAMIYRQGDSDGVKVRIVTRNKFTNGRGDISPALTAAQIVKAQLESTNFQNTQTLERTAHEG